MAIQCQLLRQALQQNRFVMVGISASSIFRIFSFVLSYELVRRGEVAC